MRLLNFAGKFIGYNGKLFTLPMSLFTYVMDVFSHGWDRNRAIDSIGGANPNALMGGYLLAVSNTTLSIAGILTTDTISPLTNGGLVGTVAVNGTMSFITGNKYGAFEVKRAGVLIGRYCLTERQGLILTNQYTGVGSLPNASIGGTTTTVWQRSNEFYSETNATGYSISSTGWVTNTGAVITVGTLIPADLVNTAKCLAWIGGVQQYLTHVGRAKNSVSVVPLSAYFSGNRIYKVAHPAYTNINSFTIEVTFLQTETSSEQLIYGMHGDPTFGGHGRCRQIATNPTSVFGLVKISTGVVYSVSVNINTLNRVITARLIYANSTLTLEVIDNNTGSTLIASTSAPATISFLATQNVIGGIVRPDTSTSINYGFRGYIGSIKEIYGGVDVFNYVNDQYSTYAIDTVGGRTPIPIIGTTYDLLQNIDMYRNAYNITGYELWTNGTDFKIYPLASDGTRFLSPAGYTLVETVAAGNMPSVADSRMSTFKYALANSHEVRKLVPEAYNTDTQATPKILTYTELSALSANSNVIKTEVNGKITNLKIRQ